MPHTLRGNKRRIMVFIEDASIDVIITIAIVWTLVLFGEPHGAIIASPLFIVLSAVSLGHLVHKIARINAMDTHD